VGARRDEARVGCRLRHLGIRRRHWGASPGTRPAVGWHSLTDTEQAVACVVAEGLNNNQVAARMYISTHTVARHLRQVFREPSITSRVELTRIVIEQAADDDPLKLAILTMSAPARWPDSRRHCNSSARPARRDRPTMTSPVSRGFHRLSRPAGVEGGKLPPGQHVTTDFPVLSAGPTPHIPLQEWTFSIRQGGETLGSWTWPEVQDMPAETVTVDIHCVTRWSKLGTVWRGVPVRALPDQLDQDAQYVLAFSDGGYTTNLPVKDVSGGQAWLASAAWNCSITTSPVSGRTTAITTTGIHGGNSDTRATELAGRYCRRSHRGDRLGPHDRAGSAGLARAPRRAASGCPADRGRRLQRRAVVLHRLGGRRAGRHHRRAARGRRDLALPDPGTAPGRPDGGTGANRKLVYLGPPDGGPLLLIAGGSSVVPLRAILRHRQRSRSGVPVRLLYSSRSLADVIYREELDQYGGSAEVRYTLTRNQPTGWGGFSGRVDAAMLARVAWPASQRPLAFICGPTPFVEAVSELLVTRHYPSSRVKTERFGGA